MSEVTSAAVEGVKGLGGNLSTAHAIFNVVTFPFIDYALKQQCQRPRLLRRAEDAANPLDLFIVAPRALVTCIRSAAAPSATKVSDRLFNALSVTKRSPLEQQPHHVTDEGLKVLRCPPAVTVKSTSFSSSMLSLKQPMPPLLLPQRLPPPLLPLQRQSGALKS
ncbi:hypothetical protein V7S43_007298 [Phytophthora oleae]|uniref:Uncharacterized protein n=1 Tax=Phytophthora oleae TaxID=2107226 RepID=A0ABD3FPQ5_9STRA